MSDRLSDAQKVTIKLADLETINYVNFYVDVGDGVSFRTCEALAKKGYLSVASGGVRYWLTDKAKKTARNADRYNMP